MNDVPEIKQRARGFFGFCWTTCRAMGWGIVIALVINVVHWHEDGYQAVLAQLTQRDREQTTQLGFRNPLAGCYVYLYLGELS